MVAATDLLRASCMSANSLVILSRLPDDTSKFCEKTGGTPGNEEMINTSVQISAINFFMGI